MSGNVTQAMRHEPLIICLLTCGKQFWNPRISLLPQNKSVKSVTPEVFSLTSPKGTFFQDVAVLSLYVLFVVTCCMLSSCLQPWIHES